MKNYWRIVKLVRNYLPQVGLNALFNILSVIFSLFSLAMVAPFLDLLFLHDDKYYLEKLSKGTPAFSFSVNSIVDNFYFFLTKMITDPDKGKIYALVFICVAVVILFFLKNLFRYLGQYFMAPIRNGVVRDLRNMIHEKTLRLPLSYYTNERKGDLMSRLTTDLFEIEWSVMNSLEVVFRDPVNIILYFAVMLFISPQLTVLVVILLPIAGIVIGRIGRSLRKSSMLQKEKLGMLFSIIEETLSGLRIIKAFNAEKTVTTKFGTVNNEFTKVSNNVYRKGDLSAPLSEFLGTTVMMVVMYYGGALVLKNEGALSASAFITYIAIFSQMIPPAKNVTVAYYNIQKGMASAERVYKILDTDEVIHDPVQPKELKNFNDKVEYRNISFTYQKGDVGHVLKNINLEIKKGKTIALVGQSGSGKTTLADMLPRFYEASQGGIYIDNVCIRDVRLHDLRALMGIVTQESILFNDTVHNNIAFGIENVSEQDVIAAAKVANAHEFIEHMPEGYQTNIGERGSKLSGGQRQRLSIARAVLKNPPILILDEATSSLDTESERLVQDAITKLMQNRTTLVIAHRLSSIQHADEIIVMQKGNIVQRGTHNVLVTKEGVYKKLYDLQSFS